MCRIEEEQTFEELKILRELVHDLFYKQEELAEVRGTPQERPSAPACSKGRGWGQRLVGYLSPLVSLFLVLIAAHF